MEEKIMSKFDSYFLMKTDDAIEYAKVKVPQISWDVDSMECKEIGDGTVSYTHLDVYKRQVYRIIWI